MSKPTKLIVVVSDLHCGSTVGLMPPGFVTEEGNELTQNPLQRWLWECWLRAHGFAMAVVNGDPFVLIVNGDATEGNHHGTKQVISPSTKDHVSCAQETLEPLAKEADGIILVKGTECHTGSDEITLGKILGATKDPDTNSRRPQHAFDRLTLEMHGTRCAFSHHIGASLRSYLEATQMSVAINEEHMAANTNGEAPPTVIVRSHRHRFGYFGNDHSLCVVTPPWQALTRFGHKVVPSARCHPGIIILDWRESDPGGLPRLHHKTYEAPQPTALKF